MEIGMGLLAMAGLGLTFGSGMAVGAWAAGLALDRVFR